MGRLLDRGREFSLEGYPVPLSRDCLFRFLEEYLFIDTSDVASVSVRFGGSKGSKVWGTNDVLPAVPLDAELEVVLERGDKQAENPATAGDGLNCLFTGQPVSIVDKADAWCAVDALHSPVAIVDVSNGLVCRYNAAWALETGWPHPSGATTVTTAADTTAPTTKATIITGATGRISLAEIAEFCGEKGQTGLRLLAALSPLFERRATDGGGGRIGGGKTPTGTGREVEKISTIATAGAGQAFPSERAVAHVPAGVIPVLAVGGVCGASAATAMALSDTHAVLYLHSYGSGPGTVVESALRVAAETAAKPVPVPSRHPGKDPIDTLLRHAIAEETASIPVHATLNGSKMVETMGQNLKAEVTLRAVACYKGGVQTPIEQTLAEALVGCIGGPAVKATDDADVDSGCASLHQKLVRGRQESRREAAARNRRPTAAASSSPRRRSRCASSGPTRSVGSSPVNTRSTTGSSPMRLTEDALAKLRRARDSVSRDALPSIGRADSPTPRPPSASRPSGASPRARRQEKSDASGATIPRSSSPMSRKDSEETIDPDQVLPDATQLLPTTAGVQAERRSRHSNKQSRIRGLRNTHHVTSTQASGLSSVVSDATRVAGADKLTVIIADDYPISLDLALNFVRETGCTSIHAADDGQGILNTLQSLRQAGEDTNKAIVITDINMPGVDGTLATAKLRSDPERYGRPYVVGCTSAPGPVSADVLAKCGMDRFVRKPLTRAVVKTLLNAAIDEQRIRMGD